MIARKNRPTRAHDQPQETPAPDSKTVSADNLDMAFRSISTVLDSIDALVYVTDMETNEILCINRYGREIWGDAKGQTCWKVLQSEQSGPCDFCTNHRLLDAEGNPTGVYVWEFQNTVNHRWYQCRDQAIRWVDGRLVRMEIATDITDRKQAEEELRTAKERAEALARTDELTGVNNRRAFLDQGTRLMNQAKRFGHAFALIMLDVDHFKRINDTYGHAIGDEVLKSLAAILGDAIRQVDLIGRLGGEEFALILPETDLAAAATFAERLRLLIADASLASAKGDIHMTASFGIAAYAGDDAPLDRIMARADEALYRAKQNGRNRIEYDS
jgi:diguanylate cyclase (GGDEF)-like protein/PAS domain S-box-containing protein